MIVHTVMGQFNAQVVNGSTVASSVEAEVAEWMSLRVDGPWTSHKGWLHEIDQVTKKVGRRLLPDEKPDPALQYAYITSEKRLSASLREHGLDITRDG